MTNQNHPEPRNATKPYKVTAVFSLAGKDTSIGQHVQLTDEQAREFAGKVEAL